VNEEVRRREKREGRGGGGRGRRGFLFRIENQGSRLLLGLRLKKNARNNVVPGILGEMKLLLATI